MKYFQRWRISYVLLLLALLAVVVLSLLLSRPPSSPLVVVFSDTKFRISSRCTFGTNHVSYYGDPVDRILDSALRRWSDTDAWQRLRYQSDQPCTVVWVRFDHPDYAKPPMVLVATPFGPVREPVLSRQEFRARLVKPTGGEIVLDPVGSMEHYKRAFHVVGWRLTGSLEDHHGDRLCIESTNNLEVVTFRLP